ncbi:MAG: hypothetical protein QHC67_13730 [Sphingobium sp.]|uniref:hypothetical protein n=1 Tax=Sphingobium sp. TaxID=1912891 RepID=UPI0029AFCFB5|nr:hypothetical protein [Sphingobium sp.]MDX3910860.1 hypothetical protein [Sphingobium sp.]
MIGNVVDDCTNATNAGDLVSDVIIQDAPTDWMSPPKFDAMLASHTARKIGMRRGEAGAARTGWEVINGNAHEIKAQLPCRQGEHHQR